MVARRDVIGGGLVTGLAAAFGGPAGGEAQRDPSADLAQLKVADAIDQLRQSIERRNDSADVAHIRAQQRTFLRANQKFPDFIDVGIDVWERLQDWHIRTGQAVMIARTNDGHYAMPFGMTTLLLQPQQTGAYISWGYDSR